MPPGRVRITAVGSGPAVVFEVVAVARAGRSKRLQLVLCQGDHALQQGVLLRNLRGRVGLVPFFVRVEHLLQARQLGRQDLGLLRRLCVGRIHHGSLSGAGDAGIGVRIGVRIGGAAAAAVAVADAAA